MMKILRSVCLKVSNFMDIITGIFLTLIMLLTTCDVVLRYLGIPILGTYELVSLGGALAIGFSSPFTFWKKSHITVDTIVEKSSDIIRLILNTSTRVMALGIVSVIGWNCIEMGFELLKAREVTPTLNVPIYPIAWGLGISFIMACLVLLYQTIEELVGGRHE